MLIFVRAKPLVGICAHTELLAIRVSQLRREKEILMPQFEQPLAPHVDEVHECRARSEVKEPQGTAGGFCSRSRVAAYRLA